MGGNLLGREVTADDVAQAFLHLALARSTTAVDSPPSTAAISPPRRAEIPMQGAIRNGRRLAARDNGSSEDILFGREGGVATVTLNRPRALNAFTLGMYRRFDPMLRDWDEDPAVRAVVVRGAGGRAFCAGGDVRGDVRGRTRAFPATATDLGVLPGRIPADPPHPSLSETVYRDHRRHHDGRRRRGFGQRRLPDRDREDDVAMPETGIGLFPDVGATRFLNLCPGHVGRYLGLTGARLGPGRRALLRFRDAFRAARADAVTDRRAGPGDLAGGRQRAQVDEVLASFRTTIWANRRLQGGVPGSTDVSPAKRSRASSARWFRGGVGRPGRRMGGRDTRRAGRQVADQPQGDAAPADRRAGVGHRGGAGAGIPADAAYHGRPRFLRRRARGRWSTRTRTRDGSRRPSAG